LWILQYLIFTGFSAIGGYFNRKELNDFQVLLAVYEIVNVGGFLMILRF